MTHPQHHYLAGELLDHKYCRWENSLNQEYRSMLLALRRRLFNGPEEVLVEHTDREESHKEKLARARKLRLTKRYADHTSDWLQWASAFCWARVGPVEDLVSDLRNTFWRQMAHDYEAVLATRTHPICYGGLVSNFSAIFEPARSRSEVFGKSESDLPYGALVSTKQRHVWFWDPSRGARRQQLGSK